MSFAALTAFRRVSARHFAEHRLRTAFTAGGIALGVAAIVAIRLVNDSASRAFESAIERVAGKSVLQISNGTGGVPEELLDEVKAVPGVKVAAPSVQGFLPISDLHGERIYVFGVDLVADDELRDYDSPEASVEDPLVFLAQPDSVAVTTEFLRRNGLAEGDTIRVKGAGGDATLTIRGALDVRTGLATLFAGRLAVMDVFAAQRLFGLDRRFTQIDVGLEAGRPVVDVERELGRRVGGRGVVERPERRGETLERLIAGNRQVFTFAGVMAVIVGLYLILNTMVIAVAERRREIGILRSTGMRRREVLSWIVVEALVLGSLGSLAGVPLGYVLARGMAGSYTASISSRFLPVPPGQVTLDAEALLWGVGLGVVASLVAALAPAREAVRMQPLEALRPTAGDGAATYVRSAIVGLACLAVAAVSWLAPESARLGDDATSIVTQLSLLLGLSFLAPTSVRVLALGIGRTLDLSAAPLSVLASRSLLAHLRTIAVTTSALLVSLSVALTMAGLITSLESTVDRVLDNEFSGMDVAIGSATGMTSNDWAPLPASLADDIAAMPQVERVGVDNWVNISHEGFPTHLVAREMDVYRYGIRKLDLIDGTLDAALAALEHGEGVVVSQVFAHRYGKRLGDRVRLLTPSGEVSLPVVGINFDLTDLGIVVIERGLYGRLWGDDRVSFITPLLKPGTDRALFIDEVRRRWGDLHGLFVFTPERIRAENDEVVRTSVAAAYPMIGIMITIALLGLVNSLAASVLDRRRELGVLRAVGATRRHVTRLVVAEAAIVGLAGGIFGVIGGSMLGYVTTWSIYRSVFGFSVVFRYPVAAALFAFGASVALSAVAGYLPSRAASSLNVAEALEYE